MSDKLMIPEDLITRDTVFKIFDKYTDSEILNNVDSNTILTMSEVICDHKASDAKSACSLIRAYLRFFYSRVTM